VWSYAGAGFNNFKGGAGRRLSDAYAGVTGIFARRTKVARPDAATTAKDRYVDQASGD
jgi:hypothetical protein